MIIKKLFFTIIIITSFSILSFANSGEATKTIQKFLWALERYKHESTDPSQIKLNDQIKKYCNYVLNIEYMGKQAMRSNWDKLNVQQREEYLNLLHQIVNNIVFRDASRQLNDMRIKYKGEQNISGNRYKVNADILIVSEKIDMKAEYVLEKRGNNYKIVDIFFDGESVVEDYHVEFNRIIRTHGVSGQRESLLNKIRRTLRQNVLDDARTQKRQKDKQRRQSR